MLAEAQLAALLELAAAFGSGPGSQCDLTAWPAGAAARGSSIDDSPCLWGTPRISCDGGGGGGDPLVITGLDLSRCWGPESEPVGGADGSGGPALPMPSIGGMALPPSITRLSGLRSLVLTDTGVSGPLPPGLAASLSLLSRLDAGFDPLAMAAASGRPIGQVAPGGGLMGPLLGALSGLAGLQVLRLPGQVKLSGALPPGWSQLPALQVRRGLMVYGCGGGG